MDQLIDTIRAAIAADASKEQKAAGLQACRTITAALDTEPGKPIVLLGTPPRPPLSGVSLDQVLDLAIAKLTTIANARDTHSEPELGSPRDAVALPSPPLPAPSRTGLRVPAPVVVPAITRAASHPRAPHAVRVAQKPSQRAATTARSTTSGKR